VLECYNLKNVSEKYFMCSSLKELLYNVDATKIIDFIKEVNFTVFYSVCCFLFIFNSYWSVGFTFLSFVYIMLYIID